MSDVEGAGERGVEMVVDSDLDVNEAWAVVTDWPRHASAIPFTTMTVTRRAADGGPGVGDVLSATTQLGPISVTDTMEVVVWEPPTPMAPGAVRIEKTGRHVVGHARIIVEQLGARSRVIWREDARPGPAIPGAGILDRLTTPLNAPTTRLLFGQALRSVLREAEQEELKRRRRP